MSNDLSRWWYHRPHRRWDVQDWLFPKIAFYECGDEFCNNTVFIRIPVIGHVVIRTGQRPFRINTKCDKCIAEHGPWCPGCRDCHQGPRCHSWLGCEHEDVKVIRCPACGGSFCPACEPEPKKTCPHRGEPA